MRRPRRSRPGIRDETNCSSSRRLPCRMRWRRVDPIMLAYSALALATILPAACRHACHDYAAPARRGCGTLAGPPSAPKTEREKNLEKDVEKTTDPTQRRKMSEELDALRRDRQRENARNQTEAAQAKQTKEANIRQRRLEGGSRFNLRYKPVVPSEALTPDGVMQALAEYLDFSSFAAEQAPGSVLH